MLLVVSTTIESAIDPVAASIESALGTLAATIQSLVGPITAAVQSSGRAWITVGGRTICRTVQAAIYAIASSIEAVFDTVTALIQLPVDAIAQTVQIGRLLRSSSTRSQKPGHRYRGYPNPVHCLTPVFHCPDSV
ncbi:MAG: hypothetical protein OES99_00315 [Gammaproteobacteria bacterium]|nr:hypothetical protein [Gammaproteobacteria bacterium]